MSHSRKINYYDERSEHFLFFHFEETPHRILPKNETGGCGESSSYRGGVIQSNPPVCRPQSPVSQERPQVKAQIEQCVSQHQMRKSQYQSDIELFFTSPISNEEGMFSFSADSPEILSYDGDYDDSLFKLKLG